MAKMKNVCAFAAVAAAVLCAFAAKANTEVDWSSVSGDVESGIYTVPADTTVNVGDGDIAAVKALSKVIFSNANSVMRFNTATYPSGVAFQGPGTALFAKKIELTGSVTVKRTLGEGDEDNLVKFVFEDGVTNAASAVRYLNTNPFATFTNATIVFNGQISTNVNMEIGAYRRWNGRFDLCENFSFESRTQVDVGRGGFGVVRQRGGTVEPPGLDSAYLGDGSGVGTYLLEGGTYYASHDHFYPVGIYTHLRQTGGRFITSRFQTSNPDNGVRHDFVFGGDGYAEIGGRASHMAYALYAFTDSVNFYGHWGTDLIFYNLSKNKESIWAHNGGVAEYSFSKGYSTDTGNSSSAPTNNFFAFNGGMRATRTPYPGSESATNDFRHSLFGYSPQVRIYENGGGILFGKGNQFWLYGPEFREPEGNVVKSIALSDELRNKVFQVPPSVEIYDEGGTGTNAAAVVDYDFDTGKITNITVLCKGEKYSASTKVNLRYKAGNENRLLETPLVCTVGPEQGGNFVFAATNLGARVHLRQTTNYCHGAIVVDMDRLGVADHGVSTSSEWNNTLHFYYVHNGNAKHLPYVTCNSHFPNVTNIILKSGCLDSCNYTGGFGYNHTHNPCGILPKCWRLELYGGHLTGGSARFEDIVVGGEVWLRNHKANNTTRECELCVCRTSPTDDGVEDYPGLLTVDVACLTNGVTPKVKYGNVRFFRGKVNPDTTISVLSGRTNSVVTIKNWQCIPKNRGWKTILDLTETGVNVASGSRKFCTPGIVYPEGSEGELLIKWEMNPSASTKPYRLLARRIANGTMLIFK